MGFDQRLGGRYLLLQLGAAAHHLPRTVLIGPDIRGLGFGVDLCQLLPQRVLVKGTPAGAGCAPFPPLRFASVLPALSPLRGFFAQLGGIILQNIPPTFQLPVPEARNQ